MDAALPASFDGSNVDSHSVSERPVSLANFEPVRVLGQGSYGKVILVYDRTVDLNFAVKLVSLETESEYDRRLVDIMEEKKTLSKLSGHSFFCDMYFTALTEQYAWFCLKFYPGGSLHDLIQKFATTDLKLGFRDARALVGEILVAVRKLHKKHFLHRDITPHNVLFDDEGHIVLSDFGLSVQMNKKKPIEEQVSRDYFETGTPFTAPETTNENLTHSYPSDFYSVGVLIDRLCAEENLDATWSEENKADVENLADQLTRPDPKERATFDKIIKHKFFENMSWRDVESRRVGMRHHPKDTAVQRPGQTKCDDTLGCLNQPTKVSRLLADFTYYDKYLQLKRQNRRQS